MHNNQCFTLTTQNTANINKVFPLLYLSNISSPKLSKKYVLFI
jgi:hypothetical protein